MYMYIVHIIMHECTLVYIQAYIRLAICVHCCCGSKSVHTCIMYMYMYDRALATAIQLAAEYN